MNASMRLLMLLVHQLSLLWLRPVLAAAVQPRRHSQGVVAWWRRGG
jgi:hypothetical protein